MSEHSSLRSHRVALRLTQAELAARAGVSRQQVAAVEAGVNTPAVDAALRLARVLGCSAEDLFGPAAGGGDRMDVVARGPAGAGRGALVVAGCDPALPVAEAMLTGRVSARGSATLVAMHATTGMALGSLRDGGVHAAVVHGPAEWLPPPPVEVIRLQLAHWQVGIGLAPGVHARTLAACLEQNVSIVQRQESAASQQALRRAARVHGYELPGGAIAGGHLDAARAAAALGCAAITTEGAALSCGLRFLPLELHTVEIWLRRSHEHDRRVEPLTNLLTSGAFAAELGRMGGYDLTGIGTVLPGLAPASAGPAPDAAASGVTVSYI